MKKVLVVFGTRPEAIKMCPLVKELKGRRDLKTEVCVSGQHRQLLDSVLSDFEVIPEYDLSVMREGQTLFDVTNEILVKLRAVLEASKPDIVLVHGDTTTAYASALCAYYMHIAVGHVEAGLRTYDIYSPFPEEYNRQAIGIIAGYHFAPTVAARENLLREGKAEETVFVTGNTAIDALRTTVKGDFKHPYLEWASGSRLIVFTAHRRENIGEPMRNMFRAIRSVAEQRSDVRVIYPIHPNPAVRGIAEEELNDCQNIKITDPLDVIDFHNIMARSYMILTDSGGIQEEASSLGKPVLVMRDTTERPEGIEAGGLLLVGTDRQRIYKSVITLLDDDKIYEKMSRLSDHYGDGRACERIADILERI